MKRLTLNVKTVRPRVVWCFGDADNPGPILSVEPHRAPAIRWDVGIDSVHGGLRLIYGDIMSGYGVEC